MGRADLLEKGLATVLAVVAAHPYDETVGYSPEVRAAVVSYASAARRAGVPWSRLMSGLPVSERTVRDWLRAAEGADRPMGALVPVYARADDDEGARNGSRGPALTLVSPSGYRLVGLDVETAARLLRSLR